MGRSTGRADLPLHGGRVPPWLAERMARLGRLIIEALVVEYGRDEVLRRLAHPFWFQSFGAVMGMDWHSSGITTSVVSALKRGLAPVADELGLYVLGGRGKQSRKTPDELRQVGQRIGVDADDLVRTSRLVAKVDNTAVQDGFQIYLHSFVVAEDGRWVVVQQGMDTGRGQARRYHWLSEDLPSFVDEPHAAIDGPNQGEIINLTDHRADHARRAQVELLEEGPDRILAWLKDARGLHDRQPYLIMPMHHEVREENVVLRRLHGTLCAAADRGPTDFESLILTPGVGPRTVESLAMVSEVVFGAPSRFTDPARFSMAHGGKDGHPFPVPLDVYDRTITVLKDAVEAAKLGQDDRMSALRRLDRQARLVEPTARGSSLGDHIERERQNSHGYGGMTVFGPARASPVREARPAKSRARAQTAKRRGQLELL